MDFLRSLFVSLFTFLNIGLPVVDPVNVPSPSPTPSESISLPSASPTLSATPTPTKTPVETLGFSESEKMRISFSYVHEQCLADQLPTGAEQFYAIDALEKKYQATYGVGGKTISEWARVWYKNNRDVWDKYNKASRAPCPIVSI